MDHRCQLKRLCPCGARCLRHVLLPQFTVCTQRSLRMNESKAAEYTQHERDALRIRSRQEIHREKIAISFFLAFSFLSSVGVFNWFKCYRDLRNCCVQKSIALGDATMRRLHRKWIKSQNELIFFIIASPYKFTVGMMLLMMIMLMMMMIITDDKDAKWKSFQLKFICFVRHMHDAVCDGEPRAEWTKLSRRIG